MSDYAWPRRAQPAKTTLWRAYKAARVGLILWTLLMIAAVIWALATDEGGWSTWLWAAAEVAAMCFLWDYVCRRHIVRS